MEPHTERGAGHGQYGEARAVRALGLDVHRDTIAAGILHPNSDTVMVEQLFHDEPSVRRFIGGLPDPGRLWACYEAGSDGLRAGPAADVDGGALRCRRAVVDPARSG